MVPSLAFAFAVVATLSMKPAAAPPDPAPDVRITVAEESPTRWRLHVENAGAVPVRVMADARLLALEVTPAGAKKPLRCALPADMRPVHADERALVMPPQRAYTETFDPRALCFGAAEAAALVPGSTVVAHLGWPAPAKGRAAHAPFEVEPLEGVVPAVAAAKELVSTSWTIAAVTTATAATPPTDAAPPPSPPPPAPSSPPRPTPTPGEEVPSLLLSTQDHDEAGSANDIDVAVTLVNAGKKPVTTLLRAETLSFEVTDPDGNVQRCGAARAVDSPIRELYDTLAPRGHASVALLLSQLCPGRTFDVPGVYLVTATLDTRRASGRSAGLVTFDGVVTARKPTRVRLHKARSSSQAPRPALD